MTRNSSAFFKTWLLLLVYLGQSLLISISAQEKVKIPEMFLGSFTDDYGIEYRINDTLWMQVPDVEYRILSWDTVAQFIIAQNGMYNPSEPGLYTRIDYMKFNGMAPYHWGFCLTTYAEPSAAEARQNTSADRAHPLKGCGGYPFSRMKREE